MEVAFYTGERVDSMVVSFIGFEVGEVRGVFITWRITTEDSRVPAIRTEPAGRKAIIESDP